jgi:hypothetical protein
MHCMAERPPPPILKNIFLNYFWFICDFLLMFFFCFFVWGASPGSTSGLLKRRPILEKCFFCRRNCGKNAFLLSELWEPSLELWEPLFFVRTMGKNGKCPVGIMGKYPSELWEEIVGIVGPHLQVFLSTVVIFSNSIIIQFFCVDCFP